MLRLGTPMAILLLATAAPLTAQPSAGRALATRAELESALEQRNAWAASTAYTERLRAHARTEAQLIRDRLRDGDFRVGDRLLMRVDGAIAFNDTVTVVSGQRIIVPGLATVDVRGVLRAELQQRAQDTFRQTVLDATVTVQPFARVAVFGAVTGPGYQQVSFDARVDELLTAAGGPVGDSRPDRFSIMRADTVLVSPEGVALAIANGRTVGDLALRDGDFLLVKPVPLPWDRASIVNLAAIFVAPVLTTLLLR